VILRASPAAQCDEGRDPAGMPPVPGQTAASLADTAYVLIEDLIVHCRLAPGLNVHMAELQIMVGIGRTPVYQAVRRLAAETLLRIRPRDGLQISPIDLKRDRKLLSLRRDLDRFVVDQASEKLTGNQRNRLLQLGRIIRERRSAMDVQAFNQLDRQLDAIMLDAAAEPFLDRTLRPLHTIFRRIGHVHLLHLGGRQGLDQTIDCHLALLDAVAERQRRRAMAASDGLIDFADSMFDALEAGIEPRLLDGSL
jgi:DNA-binding GntR family transcriptional regulator